MQLEFVAGNSVAVVLASGRGRGTRALGRRGRASVTVSSLQQAPTAAVAAAHDQAVHDEQDDRADDGSEPG